jgi:hypothetical protein
MCAAPNRIAVHKPGPMVRIPDEQNETLRDRFIWPA